MLPIVPSVGVALVRPLEVEVLRGGRRHGLEGRRGLRGVHGRLRGGGGGPGRRPGGVLLTLLLRINTVHMNLRTVGSLYGAPAYNYAVTVQQPLYECSTKRLFSPTVFCPCPGPSLPR